MSLMNKCAEFVAGVVATAGVAGAAHGQSAGAVINETVKLLAPEGEAGGEFGASVTLGGGVVAVGDPVAMNTDGYAGGAAYLFDASTYEFVAKIAPGFGEGESQAFEFGYELSIDGTMLAVGAPGSINPDDYGTGAGYLYDVATGELLRQVWPVGVFLDDRVGEAIVVRDGIVVAGAPSTDVKDMFQADKGAAYFYNASTGVQTAAVIATPPERDGRFGLSVAIADGVAAIGEAGGGFEGFTDGRAFLFDVAVIGEPPESVARLRATDDGEDDGEKGADGFGAAIAIANGVVAVGAPFRDNGVASGGAIYLFEADTGSYIRKLFADDREDFDNFGRELAAVGRTLVVGANQKAYVFDLETGEQLARLVPSDIAELDSYGHSVAVVDGKALVGGMRVEKGGNTGAVYVFDLAGLDCPADWDGNGIVNSADVGAYLSDYFLDLVNGTLVADFNEDGVTNAADVGAFLSEYFSAIGACP